MQFNTEDLEGFYHVIANIMMVYYSLACDREMQ